MTKNLDELELAACTPIPLDIEHFNPNVVLPYGLTSQNVLDAMNDFLGFLGFISSQLNGRGNPRLESFLMQANFSSIVGEYMTATIPKFCPTLVKNRYHNGHPDMIPAGMYPNDSVQHDIHGIEVKGSRYLKGWQGHNAEDAWLMVFCFDANRPTDEPDGLPPRPFEFLGVFGAQLKKEDWKFSGRSETSRRTITASVTATGHEKMFQNWIYKSPKPSLPWNDPPRARRRGKA
ncbi:hypothetical protein [Roseinatronobacter sp.]|uniref:hypothetical protein n=1 Tax=Roseinatronobacter sp. TaxID=1945755 RepID=UPI0025F34940|nr:hypothetical protein [Roseibaca sp.]